MAEQFEEVHEKLSEVDQTLDGMADEINEIVNDAFSESDVNVSYDLDAGSFRAHLPVDEVVGRINKRLDPPFFVVVEGDELVIKDVRDEYDIDESDLLGAESERDRIHSTKGIIKNLEDAHDTGAPMKKVVYLMQYLGIQRDEAEYEIEKLKHKGEVYEPRNDHLRTT